MTKLNFIIRRGFAAAAAGKLPPKRSLDGVGKVILVSSAKGGVGKSTTAANLAASLSNDNHKVGLLDADIYGPSVPTLFDISQDVKPELEDPDSPKTSKMLPIVKSDLRLMSMGFLISDPNAALVWRGPMAMAAVEKLVFGVKWTGLDYLIVDMPPGTGDIHLSLAQTLKVDGAVVISTPQKLALADARKGITMFRKVHIPILGVIENMNAFSCGHCGEVTHIFGEKGAQTLAKDEEIPFLGSVPLSKEIMESCDSGEIIAKKNPNHPASKIYSEIAKKMIGNL